TWRTFGKATGGSLSKVEGDGPPWAPRGERGDPSQGRLLRRARRNAPESILLGRFGRVGSVLGCDCGNQVRIAGHAEPERCGGVRCHLERDSRGETTRALRPRRAQDLRREYRLRIARGSHGSPRPH